MNLTQDDMKKFRLSLEATRAYVDSTVKAIESGKILDSADVKGTLALCTAQIVATCAAMDAADPTLAQEIAVDAAAKGIDLPPPTKG